jgi:hypothetical protein
MWHTLLQGFSPVCLDFTPQMALVLGTKLVHKFLQYYAFVFLDLGCCIKFSPPFYLSFRSVNTLLLFYCISPFHKTMSRVFIYLASPRTEVSSSHLTWRCKQIRFPKCCALQFFEIQKMYKFQNPIIPILTNLQRIVTYPVMDPSYNENSLLLYEYQ